MNDAPSGWTPAQVHGSKVSSLNDDEIDLLEFLGILWRKKWFILLAGLIFAALSIAWVQTQAPQFDASVSLILEENEQKAAAGLDEVLGGYGSDDKGLNSQIEVMRSRKILGDVVDSMALHEDADFVPSLGEPGFISSVISTIKTGILSVFKSSSKGASNAARLPPRERAIDELTNKLRISVIPKTNVFRISLETSDPRKSAEIVNAVASAFIKETIEARIVSMSAAAVWLSEKVSTLGETLAETEQRAADYRVNTERAVTEADVAASNVALKNARGRLSSYKADLQSDTGASLPRTDRERQRLSRLEADVQRYEEIAAKQTRDLLALRQLDREAGAAATIYEHFLKRLNEIEVQKGLQESDVRVLSAAIPRYRPTKPRKLLLVAIGTFLGLLLASAYFIVRRAFDRSFTDPAALQQAFGLPVIGAIPRAPVSKRRSLLSYALKRPSSGVMEAIRDLRTSMMHLDEPTYSADGTPQGRVIVMTSSVPGEGKTTSSLLLSINLAALGKRVLLAECDLRKSMFKTYFGKRTEFGLVDALTNPDELDSVIWHESHSKMDVIFGGLSRGRNAADIFASAEFAAFLQNMRERYDVVILDCPPVLPVPDARLIAKVSDTVIYSVHSGSTPSSTVAAGLRLFENTGVKIDGLNLTQIKRGSREAYGYGYGTGGYHQN